MAEERVGSRVAGQCVVATAADDQVGGTAADQSIVSTFPLKRHRAGEAAGVERVVADDTLTGNAGTDTLFGQAGSDVLDENRNASFEISKAVLNIRNNGNTTSEANYFDTIEWLHLTGAPNGKVVDAALSTILGAQRSGSTAVIHPTRPPTPAQLSVRTVYNSVIANGDNSPSVNDLTDFGDASTIKGTTTQTWVLANLGGEVLNLSGNPAVTITGDNASDFTITKQPDAIIPAKATTSLSIAFQPSEVGLRTATVHIASNNPGVPDYQFAIQGTGASDGMSLKPQRIDLGIGPSNPTNFTEINGTVYFVADDQIHGRQIWRTDGTAASTRMLVDLTLNGITSIGSLSNDQGELVFETYDATHGQQHWRSDGTAEGLDTER